MHELCDCPLRNMGIGGMAWHHEKYDKRHCIKHDGRNTCMAALSARILRRSCIAVKVTRMMRKGATFKTCSSVRGTGLWIHGLMGKEDNEKMRRCARSIKLGLLEDMLYL